MEKQIEIATSYKVVITEVRNLDLPELPKYYAHCRNGSEYDSIHTKLFAIIPRFVSNPTKAYTLIMVNHGQQERTDFHPESDMRRLSWLDKDTIRSDAYNIFNWKGTCTEWTEITESEFFTHRKKLLDDFEEEIEQFKNL